MSASKAIIIGSSIVGACILAFLGYTISRDRAVAEAARREQQQQFIGEQKAEHNRLMKERYDLRLDTYERQFGYVERLRLEAFTYGVRAYGVERDCKEESLSSKRCEALEKNRQALFADGEVTFTRPPAH